MIASNISSSDPVPNTNSINPIFNFETTYIFTVHVMWYGYVNSNENNCGTGINNSCEVKMQVKTTSSSNYCSNRSLQEAPISLVIPNKIDVSKNLELSWTNTGKAPCLTFDVKFIEIHVGPTTNEYTYTISSVGSTSISNIYTIVGSGNGYYQIKYWLTNETLNSSN